MDASKAAPPKPDGSWRLAIALIAACAASVVTALFTPTSGTFNTFVVAGRPLIFALLGWLAFRGRTWARWLLIAWLTYGVIVVASNVLAGMYRANVALVVIVGVSVWACLELGIAIAAGPNAKSEWLA